MAIAITPDQQALQASLRDWAKTRRQFGRIIGEFQKDCIQVLGGTERVAIGTGQDEAVQTLLAAGSAENPFFSERTGVHVATSLSIALLGERGAHPAIRKLIGTGHRQAVAETVLELLGPAGAVEGEASGEFLLTRCLSIAGGTTQILLNQVGERALGLPR